MKTSIEKSLDVFRRIAFWKPLRGYPSPIFPVYEQLGGNPKKRYLEIICIENHKILDFWGISENEARPLIRFSDTPVPILRGALAKRYTAISKSRFLEEETSSQPDQIFHETVPRSGNEHTVRNPLVSLEYARLFSEPDAEVRLAVEAARRTASLSLPVADAWLEHAPISDAARIEAAAEISKIKLKHEVEAAESDPHSYATVFQTQNLMHIHDFTFPEGVEVKTHDGTRALFQSIEENRKADPAVKRLIIMTLRDYRDAKNQLRFTENERVFLFSNSSLESKVEEEKQDKLISVHVYTYRSEIGEVLRKTLGSIKTVIC